MGRVFAAVHERMEQEVALKLLSPDAARDPQLVARFIQEARALARLQHPGVVRVHQCDRLDDGTVYLAMELLAGLSLRDWMRSHPGPVPLETALAIGWQIADVMADIHAKGIVHRDLKPENVFLCPDESIAPGHRIKLLDFGIAKVPPAATGAHGDTQVQTVAPIFLGTAAYMAPEQCRNAADIDGRADVYALGVLLYELLAGHLPFISDTSIEMLSLHLHAEPPPLQSVVPALPGALSTFITTAMLAKAPSERPTMLQCRDKLGQLWEGGQDECPLPGLAPFTEAQVELFFGRKAEIDELLRQLERARTGERRWIQIEGPSGIGKSSLVQAGLLPRLKENRPQDAPLWRIASMRPSDEPLRGLALALVAAYTGTGLEQTPEELEHAFRTDPGALRTLVTEHMPPGCCLLLVLEQMEELFTIGAADCPRLDELVATALAATGSPLRLLTTLRSDFIHCLERMPLLARQLNEATRHHLSPMDQEALTQVIQGMARRAGLRLSEGLPARMVQDVRNEGSQLPLLGHALRGLWSLRSGSLLTHERYEQLGGVGGALARQAEQLLDGLGEEGRERAKWILLELVQVGRGVPDTRRPRTRQEVVVAAGGGERAEQVLMWLSGMRTGAPDDEAPGLRLVVLSGGPEPTQQRVDLVHETLLQKVPSLAEWIERERVPLERHAALEAAAHEWEQAECRADWLPSGTLLAHYRGHTGPTRPRDQFTRMTSDRAMRFLDAAQRLDRRRTWIKRTLMLASAVAMAAIVLFAVRAEEARRRAEASEARALQEQQNVKELLQQLSAVMSDFVSNADWELGRLSGTLDIRRKLLRAYEERLASFQEQHRQRPEIRGTIIETKHRLGDLAFLDGSLDEADTHLKGAWEELHRNLELQPEDKFLTFLLGLNHSKRGKVALALGHLDEAERHFGEALTLFERPPVEGNADEIRDYRRTLATSLSEQADLELERGRTAAAASLNERALLLFEHNRDKDYDRALLAEALCQVGEIHRRGGDLKTASIALAQALELEDSLVRSNPGNEYFRWILARIHIALAELRVTEGRLGSADLHYHEAQDLGRALRKGEPENKRYALALSQGLYGDEHLAHTRGDPTHARHVRDERCALVNEFLSKDPRDVRFQRLACH
ncbi:serine/threonine-protein kinase [Archangium violaceum]|uniref:serine/threonine-protein kinase n=1 Tax=Archangium violaceum TaxID=83451 RepID=UPI001EF04FE3|nr:serine/threonine-protein kinase [Archangium violaceum]